MATLLNIRTQLRERLDDLAQPYLWSDSELTSYLNEAEREAAVRALLIRDRSTANVCEIALADGDDWKDLHPSVLEIEYMYLIHPVTSQKIPVVEMMEEELNSSPSMLTAKGIPSRYIHVGQEIRLYPMPNGTMDLELIVRRLPLADMVDDGDEPEIPAEHHYRLIDWAARCAYMKRDSDAEDATRAAKHDTLFTESFGLRPDANVRRKRNQKQADTTTPINF